jgi:hypothetical protein
LTKSNAPRFPSLRTVRRPVTESGKNQVGSYLLLKLAGSICCVAKGRDQGEPEISRENERHDLVERIESRTGLHQLEYMKTLEMGKDQYELIKLLEKTKAKRTAPHTHCCNTKP